MSTLIYPICTGHFIRYKEGMKTSSEFERDFIVLVTERVEDLGMSQSEFGKKVFGEASGDRLWRATRSPSRKRGLSLGAAVTMAEALGTDFPSLVWHVTQAAKNRASK